MQPSGIFNVSYGQEMAVVRTRLQWVVLIGALILLFTFPLFGSSYLVYLMNYLGITVILVLGLQIVTGYCGQVSFGQAAFMAVGAFSSAILSAKLGLPFWVAMPLAGLITGAVGLIAGAPSLRIKGFYLALATLAAHYIIYWLALHLPQEHLRLLTWFTIGYHRSKGSSSIINFLHKFEDTPSTYRTIDVGRVWAWKPL